MLSVALVTQSFCLQRFRTALLLPHRTMNNRGKGSHMNKTALTGADKTWGFLFGVDGLLTLDQAQGFLGVSQRTVYRLLDDGVLRRGKVRGKVVICKRSVLEYLKTVEA
jgi:excisionase family DNA binding protein